METDVVNKSPFERELGVVEEFVEIHCSTRLGTENCCLFVFCLFVFDIVNVALGKLEKYL